MTNFKAKLESNGGMESTFRNVLNMECTDLRLVTHGSNSLRFFVGVTISVGIL
jgi:hypothetical protein